MIEQHVSRGRRHFDTANSDIFAEHSFPAGGLVALSRIAYRHAPLAIREIRPGVFVFSGADTKQGFAQECAANLRQPRAMSRFGVEQVHPEFTRDRPGRDRR